MRNKILLEKYQKLKETPDFTSLGFPGQIEVVSHYGNVNLPIVEVWQQDGVWKISVEVPQGITELRNGDSSEDIPVGPL